MAEKYYSILTNRGKELEAESAATGKPVVITDFVVGDGNGAPVIPDPVRTALMNEVYRSAVSALQVSPDQANQFIAQLVLPADVGGFVVREAGLLTEAGELYSLANCAAIEKPEKSVSIRMQYRLAVSETADIELKVATGDGLFLRQDANLGDVKDAAESRENIGLKGAAVLDVGKTAGTVAAGDDTRIVNALQKNNNLSDLADKTKAREHLELKTAAQKDVTTQYDDTNVGRVMTLGCRGIGGSSGDMLPGADINTAAKYLQFLKPYGGGIYRPLWNSAVTNPDGLTKYSVNFFGNTGDTYGLISIDYSSGKAIVVGANQAGIDSGKVYVNELYGTLNKPTAGDVGAVPYRGQLGTDDLNTVTGTKYGRFCQPLSANATAARHYPITEAGSLDVHQTFANGAEGCVQEYRTFNSRRIFLRTYHPDGAVWTDWCEYYTTAKKPTAADVGAIPLTGSTNVTGLVRNAAEFQSTSANNFRIAYGGYGAFWRQDGGNLYLMLTNKDDPYGNYNSLRPFYVNLSNGDVTINKLALGQYANFDARYYTKTLADSTFQPKGSYTPAGQAYTKAESDARYSQINTASKTANSMYSKDASTGVITIAMSNITVGNNASVAVTFPTAFPNACVATVITYDGNGHGNDSDSSYAVTAYSKTGCTITTWNANGKFMLIATGY